MVKFNVSFLNTFKIMIFCKCKVINKHNTIVNNTVTKLVTILGKYFFENLNPTRYLNMNLVTIYFCIDFDFFGSDLIKNYTVIVL